MATPPTSVTAKSVGKPPLPITIRFTTSIPDLPLDIPQPSRTTVVSLKHLIRANLPASTSSRRLRLIYSGRILPDAALLPSVLKIPLPPPRAPPDSKGKGKAVEYDQTPSRVYVNCSIGDILTPEELAAEASEAESSPSPSLTVDTSSDLPDEEGPSTTIPAPRGFDRLLTTGFTPAEVGQLRLQFLSIQASINTPDTMPSPTTLRRMEDAWIDDNGATAAGGSIADSELAGGALDDLLWGIMIGFLWPLGAMAWLSREEGVWSERRQTAIWSGFIVCLVFGTMNFLQ